MWLAAGGAIMVIVCLGIAVAGGSRLDDLWKGLVVIAVRVPQVFILPLSINPGYDVWAALSLVAAFVMAGPLTRSRVPIVAFGMFRVGVGFFTWLTLLLLPSSIFLLALPLTWVATQAPPDDVDSPTNPYCRLLLPALAVLECLQAYPVAGTQLSLAALCLVPVGTITLGDGMRQLRIVGAARQPQVKLGAWVAPAAVAISVAVFLLFAIEATAGFETSAPLRLPGAASMRLPVRQDTALRGLIAAIDRDCSSFITFPGMDSLYVWAAEEPPTPVRYGQWWLRLDAQQQRSIVQQLEGRQRLCVVKNQKLIYFWTEGRQVPRRPLVDFIETNFVDDGSFGDYELLVRR
jgi:hypothetical protein